MPKFELINDYSARVVEVECETLGLGLGLDIAPLSNWVADLILLDS